MRKGKVTPCDRSYRTVYKTMIQSDSAQSSCMCFLDKKLNQQASGAKGRKASAIKGRTLILCNLSLSWPFKMGNGICTDRFSAGCEHTCKITFKQLWCMCAEATTGSTLPRNYKSDDPVRRKNAYLEIATRMQKGFYRSDFRACTGISTGLQGKFLLTWHLQVHQAQRVVGGLHSLDCQGSIANDVDTVSESYQHFLQSKQRGLYESLAKELQA